MVNLNTLILKIAEKIQKDPFDRQAYEDYYATGKELLKQDDPQAVGYLKWLAEQLNTAVPALVEKDLNQAKDLMAIHRRTLQTLAPVDFDSYLLFVEWNREPKKKFYVPRRAILKQVVDALQDLADDKLDILAISMPPGVGKTTLALFYLTWLAGKYPDDPILTGSHSNSFIRGTYDECLRIFEANGEYLWAKRFPAWRCVTRTPRIAVSTLAPGSGLKPCNLPLSERATQVCTGLLGCSTVTIWCPGSRLL